MRVTPLAEHDRIETEHLAVGHVTIDVFSDGSRSPGGTALYSSLLAARCGSRAAIVTAGSVDTIASMLAPLDDDVDVFVQPAPETTTLATFADREHRRQRLLARAPEVRPVVTDARVVHLAPVVAEVGSEWCLDHGAFVGLTPQGLVRRWDAAGDITLHEPAGIRECVADAIVLSQVEEPYCGPLLARAEATTLIVITREHREATARLLGEEIAVPALSVEGTSDVGAGDVFSAALFCARASGAPVRAAVEFAHAAGAAKVAGPPGPAGVPDRSAIEALLRPLGRAEEPT